MYAVNTARKSPPPSNAQAPLAPLASPNVASSPVNRVAVMVGQRLAGTCQGLYKGSNRPPPPAVRLRSAADAAQLLYNAFLNVCIVETGGYGRPGVVASMRQRADDVSAVVDQVGSQPMRNAEDVGLLRQGVDRASQALRLLAMHPADPVRLGPFIGALLELPPSSGGPGTPLDRDALDTVAAKLAWPAKQDRVSQGFVQRQLELAPIALREAYRFGLLDGDQAAFVLDRFRDALRCPRDGRPGLWEQGAQASAGAAGAAERPDPSRRERAGASTTAPAHASSATSAPASSSSPDSGAPRHMARAADVFRQLRAGTYVRPNGGPGARPARERPLNSAEDAAGLLYQSMTVALGADSFAKKSDVDKLTGSHRNVGALVSRLVADQEEAGTKPGSREWLDTRLLEAGAPQAARALQMVSTFPQHAYFMQHFIDELLRLPVSSTPADAPVDRAAMSRVAEQLAARATHYEGGSQLFAQHLQHGLKTISHARGHGLLRPAEAHAVEEAFRIVMNDLMRPAARENDHRDRPSIPRSVPVASAPRQGPAGGHRPTTGLMGAVRRFFGGRQGAGQSSG